MNYKELLKILQKYPNKLFLDAQGSKPFEGGILLVEKHEMNFGNCGNHTWFFRTPKEFVDFLPALLFTLVNLNRIGWSISLDYTLFILSSHSCQAHPFQRSFLLILVLVLDHYYFSY
jgi:hypothetical protein